MREPIYLIVDRTKVVRMVKNLGRLERGQIPIKLTVEVKPDAFREPVIEREVIVDDWSDGIALSDVTFEKNIITEKEAEMVKASRLKEMKAILENHGYSVKEKSGDEE